MKTHNDVFARSFRELSAFNPQIARARKSFFNETMIFPHPIRNAVVNGYQSRILRGHKKPLLGECAPWLLADLLRIKNRRGVDNLISPWMNLYAFTLITDDVLDRNTNGKTAPLLLASSLLLQRGLSGFFSQFPNNKDVRIRVDRLFVETASAAMEEITRHKHKLSKFTSKDVDHVGQKVAFLKLCATGLLACDGSSNKFTDDLLVPVEYLATGMQLLDDITDWKEDWRAGNYSFLLTETFSKLSGAPVLKFALSTRLTKVEVFAAMVLTGSLEKCLAKAIYYLQRVCIHNAERRPTAATRALDVIIEENRDFKKEVGAARKCLLGDSEKTAFDGNLLRRFANDKKCQKQLNYLEKKLQVVATNS